MPEVSFPKGIKCKTMQISPEMHLAIKMYAQGNGLNIQEATQRLLREGLKLAYPQVVERKLRQKRRG